VEHLADRLAEIPGVVAVSLGGSRATGTAGPDSDWDFGLYYRGTIDPADVAALGWPGRVFAPREWGRLVDGGAWLSVDGARVDLCYRDLDVVLRWTAEAEAGRFEIQREVGYVAGIPTYVLAAELGLGRVLAGTLPRPTFPAALRASAPPLWSQLAAGALHHAGVFARRGDRVACVANAAQAVLACGWARMAADGRWSVNEKRLVATAGLDAAQAVLADDVDLVAMVDALTPVLDLPPWAA
jgi:hypothetical protein